MSDFPAYLSSRRTLFEGYLRNVLHEEPGLPDRLLTAMRYSLLGTGKRLRALLVIMAAEAVGASPDVALPAGAAVEMVHTYSLIHDDLPAMDDDDLRRGQPTCHKKFGEALAILAGDGLLTQAFSVLAENYPARTASLCCRALAKGAGPAGMVGGQVDDLAWEQGGGQLTDLESVHARKTGALICASLHMGAHVAQAEQPTGTDPNLLALLDQYGREVGLAFQITDDLLDVEGQVEHTGKHVQKDAARGKLTYPSFLGVAESRRRAEQLCRSAQECLAPLGQAGWMLAALAESVGKRDR